MTENHHTKCLVCESPAISALKGYERHDLVKCRDCGFVFMRHIPSEKELRDYYSVYAYGSESEMPAATRISIEKLLDEFDKYRISGRMLDVGAGEGWILQLAKLRGWDVHGTELSERAVDICRRKGITMYQGVLDQERIPHKDFDVIISSETIEHINNPSEETRNIFSLLRKGGLFYVTTPNFNCIIRYLVKDKYDIIRYPEHLSYYTRSTMNTLLKKTGFTKIKCLTTGLSISRYRHSIEDCSGETLLNRNADEKLRDKIAGSGALRLVKNIVNRGLSFLGIGLTIKAYYSK